MDELLQLLNQQTDIDWAHYGWSRAPEGDYGIVAEDSGEDFIANDVHLERGTAGTVDLFTRDDTDTQRITVETVLNSAGVCWRLNSVQFESDTGLIHYEWLVGIYG